MNNKPNHTCFPIYNECAGCAFELGERLARKKPKESAKYIWMIVGSDNPCDIRRYAFSYKQAVSQLEHAKKRKYKDGFTGGIWTLFKLVRVNRSGKSRKRQ